LVADVARIVCQVRLDGAGNQLGGRIHGVPAGVLKRHNRTKQAPSLESHGGPVESAVAEDGQLLPNPAGAVRLHAHPSLSRHESRAHPTNVGTGARDSPTLRDSHPGSASLPLRRRSSLNPAELIGRGINSCPRTPKRSTNSLPAVSAMAMFVA